MPDIVISYASGRRQEAASLKIALEKAGYVVWWDGDLDPGKSYEKEIRRHIENVPAHIVIWTPEACASDWVPAEASVGYKLNKLLCVRTADISSNQLPLPFSRIQAVLVTEFDAIAQSLDERCVPQSRRIDVGALSLHNDR